MSMTTHVGMLILASKNRNGAYLTSSRTIRTSAEFRKASRRARWFEIGHQFRRSRERALIDVWFEKGQVCHPEWMG